MWYILLWLPMPIIAAGTLPKALSFVNQARTNTIQHHLSTIALAHQQELTALVKKKGRIQEALAQAAEHQQAWSQEFVRFDSEIELLNRKINEAHARIHDLEHRAEERRLYLLIIAEKKARLKLIEKKCTEAFALIASNTMDEAQTSIIQANAHLAELVAKRPSVRVINNCFGMYLETERLWCVTLCKKINHGELFTKTCQEIFDHIQDNNLSQARLKMSDITDAIKTQHTKLYKQEHLVKQLMPSLSLAWSTRAFINQELEESDHTTHSIPCRIDPEEIVIERVFRDFFKEEFRHLVKIKQDFADKLQQRANLKKELDDTNHHIELLKHHLKTTTLARFAPSTPAPARAASPDDATLLPVVRAVLAASSSRHTKTKTAPKKTNSSVTVLPSIKTQLRSINLSKQTRVIDPKPPRQPFHSDVYSFQRPIPERKEEVR